MTHSALLESLWPLLGLRITVPSRSIELRIPDDDDLAELVTLAAKGIHPPEMMPFAVPWTDLESPAFERAALQYHWSVRVACSPSKWDLGFIVIVDGRIVGTQSLHTVDFPALKTAETGSWLGREHQGQGLGKLMRSVVVQFAFQHLGAERITSGAFADNLASHRVSIATGYEPNGTTVLMRRGKAAGNQKFLLNRQRWAAVSPKTELNVQGLEPCRDLLGLTNS